MPRQIQPAASYQDKLTKLIPGEVIAAYLAIQNLVMGEPAIRDAVLLASAAILLFVIPFYLRKVHQVSSVAQIVVTAISFLVWVFSVSVVFITAVPIHPLWGSVVLILWTTIVPSFDYQKDG